MYSPRYRKDAIRLHPLCIEAVLFALKIHGRIIHLSECTFLIPQFTFLGSIGIPLTKIYQPLNNRIQAIKEFRSPQSIPECLSRVSSFQYYASLLPFLKRLAIPICRMMQSNVFTWNKKQNEASGNLRFLMSLHIKNSIFNPKLPFMLFSDSSMIEVAAIISQWNP